MGMLAPIWGTAGPGEKVTVSLGDQQTAATADSEGKWMVRLNPPDAGGPFEVTV